MTMPTYSGLELFRSWLTAGRPPEHTVPDGTFLYCHVTMDFDYLMGYMLEVRNGDSSDYLFCFERHGGGRDLTVEWLNQPAPTFSEAARARSGPATHRFVQWVYTEVERYQPGGEAYVEERGRD